MDTALSTTDRPPGRVRRGAARYRDIRAEFEPLLALIVDLAALGALLYRHGANARARIQAGGER